MPVTQQIRRRGFRRWYERELLVGHSHLVLLLLCTLALLGAFEAFSQPGAERLLLVLSVLVAGALGVWALRRYLFRLMRAELIANQAVCARCQTYARWQVDDGGPPAGNASGSAEDGDDDPGADGVGETISVCCRKCQHRWNIRW